MCQSFRVKIGSFLEFFPWFSCFSITIIYVTQCFITAKLLILLRSTTSQPPFLPSKHHFFKGVLQDFEDKFFIKAGLPPQQAKNHCPFHDLLHSTSDLPAAPKETRTCRLSLYSKRNRGDSSEYAWVFHGFRASQSPIYRTGGDMCPGIFIQPL